MAETLNALLQASVWLAITVVLLAALRPLLLALGGAALVYRSWWCVPVLLLALHLPLPMGPMVDALPVLAAAVAWTAPVVVPAAPAWPWLLLLAWALGALGMGGASWRAQRRFERAMGTLRPRADGTWQASADPGLPALVGLWAPRIVVGPAFEADFSPAEQHLILQHERSHRRHGDPRPMPCWPCCAACSGSIRCCRGRRAGSCVTRSWPATHARSTRIRPCAGSTPTRCSRRSWFTRLHRWPAIGAANRC